MEWVKLPTDLYADDRFIALSHPAFRLYVNGLAWCGHRETDGFIPTNVLRVIGGNERTAKALVEAGIWSVAPGGFAQDWSKQSSKSEQTVARESAKFRKQKSRESRASALGHAVTSGVTDGVTYAARLDENREEDKDSSVLTDSPVADAPVLPAPAVVEEPKVPEAPKVDHVGEVWAHYLAGWKRVVNGKRAPMLNAKRRTHIKARLRELGLEDTKRAIDGLFLSTFHVDGGWTAPEYAFRSTEQAEKMLANAPPSADNGPRTLFQTENGSEVPVEVAPRLRASSEGDAAETNEPAKESVTMPVLIKLAGGVK